MAKRKIIKIDESRCNGCGLCLPNCPEGALKIIDGKARLIGDLFCDGLGACLGHCPQGAIEVEERQAEEYDERKVMENIVKQGKNVISAHLEHLKSHGETGYFRQALDFLNELGLGMPEVIGHHSGGCPGSRAMELKKPKDPTKEKSRPVNLSAELVNWPIQIKLVPEGAPYFKEADLLIAADCVPFSYAGFHQDLLKDKILLIGCPKLDDVEFYQEKLTRILKNNNIRSVTCAHMEVPCCFGLVSLVKSAISGAKKNIPFEEITIGLKGERFA